jgi:DNA-binding Xre family transcriptional regulator
MSTTADLVLALEEELKAAQMTYADLAEGLGMAESSVKRMLAKGDMALSRIDAICRVLKLDFAELARRVADAQPLLKELTQEQEKAVVADKKLLLCAICVLSQWTLEQVTHEYRLSEPSASSTSRSSIASGIIELRPMNRYRPEARQDLPLAPHGPVMNYFRDNAVLDYFSGGFDGAGRGPAAGARLGAAARSRTSLRGTPCSAVAQSCASSTMAGTRRCRRRNAWATRWWLAMRRLGVRGVTTQLRRR